MKDSLDECKKFIKGNKNIKIVSVFLKKWNILLECYL